jgi:DNA helicase-2/ATP-dependent DNA helicase PcrA
MLDKLLGLGFEPVAEQADVIGMSAEGIHLVLAGAGSGKTETMSLRALWLVATHGIRPEEVLGLTFTRKAARELAERFRRRIALLRHRRAEFAALGVNIDHLVDDDHGFATPTVSTYNAFASEIFAEHAARIGWDSDSPVITEATAYAIARGVVQVAAAHEGAKRRTFRRFSYRGVDLEQLLELPTEELVKLFGARQRRR